jgi:hypothetical protein
MKASRHELEKFAEILRQAYLGKESFEVGNRWQKSVMARVREIGPLNSCHVFRYHSRPNPQHTVFHRIKTWSAETSGRRECCNTDESYGVCALKWPPGTSG